MNIVKKVRDIKIGNEGTKEKTNNIVQGETVTLKAVD